MGAVIRTCLRVRIVRRPNAVTWAGIISLSVCLTAGATLSLTLGQDEREEAKTEYQPIAEQPDCGAKSLYVVCKWCGKTVGLAELRDMVGTGSEGTTMLRLKLAAERLGLRAEGVKIAYADLLRQLRQKNGVAILHVRNTHFIAAAVSRGSDRSGQLEIIDPALGPAMVKDRDLVKTYGWDGCALIVCAP
jgi:ABC-type bacteriocin/lantibiotic exporter with double-glycine peptidase domain